MKNFGLVLIALFSVAACAMRLPDVSVPATSGMETTTNKLLTCIMLACISCITDGRSAYLTTNTSPYRTSEFRRRPNTEWPYGKGEEGIWKRDTTLGQLCKTASAIVVARVRSTRNVSPNEVQSLDGRYLEDIAKVGLLKEIELAPEKNLLGSGTFDPVTVWLTVMEDIASVPKNGDRVIAFLSDGFYDPHEGDVHAWDFDRERATAKKRGWRKQRIDGSSRGILGISGEEGSELFSVVEEYVMHLRGLGRDQSKYYAFLQKSLSSHVERIQLDARTDMLFLMPSLTVEELDALTKTEKTDPQIMKYAQDILESRKNLRPAE